MKALTVSQPWADLIASGEKWIENRTWYCRYRGPLAIHAGKGGQYLSKEGLSKYVTGAVIAVCELVGCYSREEIFANYRHRPTDWEPSGLKTWEELARHEHTHGLFCLLLANVRRIEPVPCRGMQGLWEWYPAGDWERLTRVGRTQTNAAVQEVLLRRN